MTTKIMPISELRRRTSEVLDELRDKGDEVYVTRYGHPVAVLVKYEHYEQLKECSEHDESAAAEKQDYPTVATPLSSLYALSGSLKDGYEGDALADTEALYDGD
ncbi:MAG: type II toxin-antitoxin system prevent-host-death family antitoxin [Chloroflexi bacterium]|nr:type II toxin-antitoxin system prevent-host-death family antitoxin [Chloroflexota bacterium]